MNSSALQMTLNMRAVAIDGHYEETNERQHERDVGGRVIAEDSTLVDDHRL